MTRPGGLISFNAVRRATDLAALVADCGVVVNRSRMAVCPFHDDRRPSLLVKGDYWRCFGCGEHGDVFTWCERFLSMTTGQALRFLAARAGIAPGFAPEPVHNPDDTEARKRELRRRFIAWIGAERGKNAGRIRRLDAAIGRLVACPEDLGTETAKALYDRRARLEGLDEALWGRDMDALIDYYRERTTYAYR